MNLPFFSRIEEIKRSGRTRVPSLLSCPPSKFVCRLLISHSCWRYIDSSGGRHTECACYFSRIICRRSSVVFIEQNFGPHMLQ